MAWTLSTGAVAALEKQEAEYGTRVRSTGITFGDGDGTGGTDTINAASGLDVFNKHEWILIDYYGNADDNKLVKVLTVTATKIEVAAGSLTAKTNADEIGLAIVSTGSLMGVFRNMTMHLFGASKPSDADASEGAAVIICKITLDGNTFVAGAAENGLNFGQYASGLLRRAIDPDTGNVEDWQGENLQDGTIYWGRIYANDLVTGASTTGVRMDGDVSTTTGDIVLTDRVAVAGTTTEVVDVRFKVVGTTYTA